jgi:AraC-like DNA-binding protein
MASPASISPKNITNWFMVSSNLANHLDLVDNSEHDATIIEETRHAMTHRKTDPPRGVLKTAAADRSRYRHERYHPSADLDPYVEHYWVVEWDLRGLAPERAETLPHPSVHMVFERDGGSLIWGAARAKFSRLLEDKGGVFAVKFTPGGFYPFVGVPVSRFSDRTVPIHDVFGAEGDAMDRAVLAESSDTERINIVEGFLRARRTDPDENVLRVTEIIYAVAKERGILKVEDLVERYGMNKRTLQRLFAKYAGVSPKWVIQRYRLHEAAEQLATGAPVNQAELALNLGYSDQAHFVRDFKAIVGISPAAYARAARQD